MNEITSPESPKTGVFQGSNDNETWTDLAEIHIASNATGLKTEIAISDQGSYKYFRSYFTESWTGVSISIQQIYIYDDADHLVEALPNTNCTLTKETSKGEVDESHDYSLDGDTITFYPDLDGDRVVLDLY